MIVWTYNKIISLGVVVLTLLCVFPLNVPALTLRKRDANLRSPVILGI